jgi:positive phototaxis protein PixI
MSQGGRMDEMNETIAALKNYQSGLSRLETLFAEAEPAEAGQKFLRFRLCLDQTALLPVDEIAAVLTVEAKNILPVPHMPDCVLGIYNWRGEVLWLLDLASQVGLNSLAAQTQRSHSIPRLPNQFMAIVAQVNGQSLGLATPEVYDIEQHNPSLLQSPLPEMFPPKLLPFVKGYLTSAERRSPVDQRSTVLDIATILQDPRLCVHELN